MDVEDARGSGVSKWLKAAGKKLKGTKNIQIVVAIFIIAVALIIYSGVAASKEKKTDQTVMTSEETRLSAILSKVDGAGEVETMISSSDGKIVGVLVLAEGADSISVRIRLLEAAACALGVDKNIVSVYGKK